MLVFFFKPHVICSVMQMYCVCVLFHGITRKSKEAHHCSEKSCGHCLRRRAVPLQFPQPGHTNPQVGLAESLFLISFCSETSLSCCLPLCEGTCLDIQAGRSWSSSVVSLHVTQPTSMSWSRWSHSVFCAESHQSIDYLIDKLAQVQRQLCAPSPPSDPEVSEGAGVCHRSVSRGPGMYSADERDRRLVPRDPGWEPLQRAADASHQTSSCQLLLWMLFNPHGWVCWRRLHLLVFSQLLSCHLPTAAAKAFGISRISLWIKVINKNNGTKPVTLVNPK